MTRVSALSVNTGRETILYNLQLVALDTSFYFITCTKLKEHLLPNKTVLPYRCTLLNILCFKCFLVSIIQFNNIKNAIQIITWLIGTVTSEQQNNNNNNNNTALNIKIYNISII
jgi:hypothetical protein